jgi:hypothetical protein
VLGSLPAHPHPRQGSPDSFPRYPLFGKPLLETYLGSQLHRPKAAIFAELSRAPVEHLAQSLHTLLIEGPMNGVRTVRASSERLFETLLVELVDGVARSLRITAEVAGDLVGVLAIGTCEQNLATAQGEGIWRAQSRLQGFALGVTQRTHVYGSLHGVEDNH